ncbi:MAG: hypothetical protein PHE54_01510 [Bacilli bacterium]|nr:hypothetical protein [Bacilli bacterium]
MNEKKRVTIILVLMAIVIITIPIFTYINNKEGNKIVTAVKELLDYNGTNVVYLGDDSDSCSNCSLYNSTMIYLKENYDVDYNYVDLSKLNDDQYDEVIGLFDISTSELTKPYLLIVTNGEVVAYRYGYDEGDETFSFLQNNDIINAEYIYISETPYLNKINFEEYNNMIASDTKKIIVLMQVGCSACTMAKPILNEIAEEYDMEINYFVLNDVDTEEENNEFMASLSYYSDNKEIGTPLALIVSNNEVLAVRDGFYSKEDYVAFFKTNGFINE